MNQRTAIYQIESPSGKVYVGSAVDYTKRWQNHRSDLRLGRHCNLKLQRAWNKYGEGLRFSVVEVVGHPEQLLAREQYWIDKLDAYRSGYNMTPTAGSPLGRKHSEATKQKLREINSSPAFRAAHSALHRGKIVSAETREKQSAAKRGKPKSEETKQRMRESHLRRRAALVHQH